MAKDIRDLWGNVKSMLEDGGAISKHLPTYETRPCQEEMADSVFKSLVEECHAVIEAGTGTGKTIAYLVPSIFISRVFKEPVVVSTKTINLQEQIILKDVPLLQKAMDEPFKAVIVKGWGNYICLRRLKHTERSKAEFSKKEFLFFRKLFTWAQKTISGDKSDINFEIVNSVWERVRCESSACPYRKCPYFEKCFFFNNRREMQGANILVTNHALLFTHLAMKRMNPQNEHPIFPKFQRLVIDEAHHIEEVSSNHLGDDISSTEFIKILKSLYSRRGAKDETGLLLRMRAHSFSPGIKKNVKELIDSYCIPQITTLRETGDTLFGELVNMGVENEYSNLIRLTPAWKKKLPEYISDLYARLVKSVKDYSDKLETLGRIFQSESGGDFDIELKSVVSRLKNFSNALSRIWKMEDENFIYSLEAGRRTNYDFVRFKSYPLVVSEILYEELFKPLKTTILTSATLSINRNFKYILGRLGLDKFEDDIVVTKIFDSPFDFKKQAIMAVPGDMPGYHKENFLPMTLPHLVRLIRVMEGRTFILFTSYKMLRQFGEKIREKMEKDGFNILIQGESARHTLLDSFKQNEKSVLLGTDSFWEGVDVPGRDLECVVLVKLPFKVPTDPLIKARSEYMEKEGKNPFFHYQLPQAIIKFKQGFGRLIRNRKDRGVILTLDRRIMEKKYGMTFLLSLPKVKIIKGSFAGIVEYIKRWKGRFAGFI